MLIQNKIAVLGLDNVGKTTLIRRLLNIDLINRDPPRTQGFDVTEIILKREKANDEHIDVVEFPILFIDVGGLKVFQLTLWEELITSDIIAVIYVVDVNESVRIHNDLDAFRLIINNTNKVPILVLGNKVDVNENGDFLMKTNNLFEILDIVDHKINDPFREIVVLPISAKTGLNFDLFIDWLYRIFTKKNTT